MVSQFEYLLRAGQTDISEMFIHYGDERGQNEKQCTTALISDFMIFAFNGLLVCTYIHLRFFSDSVLHSLN